MEWLNSHRLFLRPSQRDWGGHYIYKNWDVKSAFTTNPLANPNLQGDAAANPVETQAFIIFNRPVDQTVVSMQFNLLREYWYDAVWLNYEQWQCLKLITVLNNLK